MSKIEDVILSVPEVRHKKSEGSLYIMSERIVFMVGREEKVAVSHSFSEIKSKDKLSLSDNR